MSTRKQILVRATPYRCTHQALGLPYWTHRAYELEIVGHGHTMAPRASKISDWALSWLECSYGEEAKNWEVIIEWN